MKHELKQGDVMPARSEIDRGANGNQRAAPIDTVRAQGRAEDHVRLTGHRLSFQQLCHRHAERLGELPQE